MPASRLEPTLFALILGAYLLAGGLFAITTPRWQAPDEPAHYNYIAQLAANGCCPRIADGDWQSDYQQQLTTAKFAPHALERLATLQYEDHQPPLYYLLATPLYALSGGSLTALRLLSVGLGAGTVGLTCLIGRRILPHQPQVALGAMALLAFHPQRLSITASVNNDVLGELVTALALLWLIDLLQNRHVPVWRLGLLMGIALLSKTTTYFLALLIPLAILLKWRQDKQPPHALLRSLALFALTALGISALWWLRNITVYGFPDFLGLAAHDAVVSAQPRTADYIAAHGWTAYLREMLRVSFNSFWGQFGWMALPLDAVLGGWIYRGFALLSAAGLSGLLAAAWARRRPPSTVSLVLGAAILLVLAAYLYYNSEFQQWQGRYLFAALIPFALALVYGLDYWRGRLFAKWQGTRWLLVLALMCLFPLDLYLLFRVIVPQLAP